MNWLFEFNDLTNVTVEEFQGSKIYIMDNFYKHPEEILSLFYSVKPTVWKENETPSFNTIHFDDLRHDFDDERMLPVTTALSKLCNEYSPQPNRVVTNIIKFKDKTFNDFKNNYWGPHCDLGYTALVYFNTFDCPGTNLYEVIEEDVWNTSEHFEPWRSKQKYRVIKTIESKFNRLVLFDGRKFFHGMNISDDRFFNTFRINQAIFFKPDSLSD